MRWLLAVTVVLTACAMPVNWCADRAAIDADETPLAVESTVREADTSRALDIVFVSDGFDRESIDVFRDHVRELIEGFDGASALLRSYREQLNFYRVDTVGHFGTCVDNDDELSGDQTIAQRVALAAVPAADVVVIVAAWEYGEANARIGVGAGVRALRISLATGARVLVHELGHAAFGLGDEYTESDERYPTELAYSTGGDVITYPNLTSELHGTKWSALVDGARRGGAGYAHGIYHPTDHCRMLRSDEDDDFCPVCAARVREVFEVLADPAAAPAPPACELLLDQSPEWGVHGRLQVVARAFALPTARLQTFELDGAAVYDVQRDTQAPAAEHSLAYFFDTASLANGWHLATARCVDAAGRASEARLPLPVAN